MMRRQFLHELLQTGSGSQSSTVINAGPATDAVPAVADPVAAGSGAAPAVAKISDAATADVLVAAPVVATNSDAVTSNTSDAVPAAAADDGVVDDAARAAAIAARDVDRKGHCIISISG